MIELSLSTSPGPEGLLAPAIEVCRLHVRAFPHMPEGTFDDCYFCQRSESVSDFLRYPEVVEIRSPLAELVGAVIDPEAGEPMFGFTGTQAYRIKRVQGRPSIFFLAGNDAALATIFLTCHVARHLTHGKGGREAFDAAFGYEEDRLRRGIEEVIPRLRGTKFSGERFSLREFSKEVRARMEARS